MFYNLFCTYTCFGRLYFLTPHHLCFISSKILTETLFLKQCIKKISLRCHDQGLLLCSVIWKWNSFLYANGLGKSRNMQMQLLWCHTVTSVKIKNVLNASLNRKIRFQHEWHETVRAVSSELGLKNSKLIPTFEFCGVFSSPFSPIPRLISLSAPSAITTVFISTPSPVSPQKPSNYNFTNRLLNNEALSTQ